MIAFGWGRRKIRCLIGTTRISVFLCFFLSSCSSPSSVVVTLLLACVFPLFFVTLGLSSATVFPLFFVTLGLSSASVSTWLHGMCLPGGTHFGYSQCEYPVDPFLVTTSVSTRLTLFCYNQCEYPVDPCVVITSVSTRLTPVCL